MPAKFSEFGFHPLILSGIEKNNFTECTPIQEGAIPVILQGKDLAGLAQTGTGKTAAFLLPMMERILRGRELQELPEAEVSADDVRRVRAFRDWRPSHYILVLVPTRELAVQVFDNVKSLGAESGMKAVAVYGGTSYEPQKDALNRGVEFVVATPGRLIDLYKERVVDLSQVRAIVFDEADRMFDMGFKDDMQYILKRVPHDRQFLVFSATLNFDVLNVAYEAGAEPVEVNVSRDQAKAENVKDQIFHVGQTDKPTYLLSLLQKEKPRQAIVFSNFKRNVDRIAKFLSQNGVPAMGISSLLTQAQRNRVMAQFKAENDQNILVATDVAARGLDIKGVDLVVNYELPDDPENYVHRIGRTGRAGEEGKAFSLVSDRDVEALGRVEGYLQHKLEIGWLDDTDLVRDHKPFPREEFEDRKPFERPQRRDRGERGGERGGRGRDRNRGPRRDFDRDRGRDFDRDRDRQRAEGSDSQSHAMHRDRQTGRHRHEEGRPDRQHDRQQGPGPRQHQQHRDQQGQPGQGQGRHQRPQRRPDRSSDRSDRGQQRRGPNGEHREQRRHQGRPHRPHGPRPQGGHPMHAARRTSANQSITQKVSGFFKKLFGQ